MDRVRAVAAAGKRHVRAAALRGADPRLGTLTKPPPPGFRTVPAGVLAGLRELPCDVFVRNGARALLYATVGADAAGLAGRAERGLEFLVREEDDELLSRMLADALPGVLSDSRLPPAERSRAAYTIAARVVRPILAPEARVDQDRLAITHDAIDAIASRLLVEEDIVWSMVATMQKHLTTHTHALNTAVYAVILAEVIGVSASEELLDAGRGALLHDIGKIRVPEAVLDKPGPLDAREWAMIRRHPRAGHDLVIRALGYVPGYAHIIAEHHERVDGSGYPSGRRGSQVALDSQLVAIVDAFDALTSTRSYKAAATPFEALRTMRFQMRGQFNDGLLLEFIGLLGDWQELRRTDLHALEAVSGP